jgi:cytochrome c556
MNRGLKAACALALAAFAIVAASPAQTPPPPDPAKQAIENRQAIYKLIGNNFKPIGDVLQGRAQFDAAEVQKRATRVAFLSKLAGEAFPDVSNTGLPNTKAKADIWSNRSEFDNRLARLADDTQALAQVAAKETSASDAFKSAAVAVAQDCKGCHDNFREK